MATKHGLNTNSDTVQLYEVIRIIDDIPIFLEDHLSRLYLSAHLTGMGQLPEVTSLTGLVKTFVNSQKKDIGNIKLSFTFSKTFAMPLCELNYIPHAYPTKDEYTYGVKVGLLYADRLIPNAKIQNSEIRDRANKAISEKNLYEVLLIDSKGNITEGSRSNVFFVKNETLYSAPGDKILQGITRIKILNLCKTANIQVVETEIPASGLNQYEAAFLTGTSPKVLPISSIEKVVYKTDILLLIKLQKLYDQLIDDYISNWDK